MIIICNEEISKLRKLEESEGRGGQGAQRRGGVNTAVADDVTSIFKGKTVHCITFIRKNILRFLPS